MSYRHSNSSQVSEDFHGLKDAMSEADCKSSWISYKNSISNYRMVSVDSMEGSEDKRDKKKESKKFLFKKDSKDKGYSTLSADNNQDSVFLVNTK